MKKGKGLVLRLKLSAENVSLFAGRGVQVTGRSVEQQIVDAVNQAMLMLAAGEELERREAAKRQENP